MLSPTPQSWPTFKNIIKEIISQNSIQHVLEIGAGANPYISQQDVTDHILNYTIVDIDDSEINKASGSHFTKIVHDITDLPLIKKYDLIFSHMVLEHIPNPSGFHDNVLKMMHDNSTVIHFFATKYGLPSLANLILPSFISDFIIFKIQKRDPVKEGKFKSYYRNCTGPIARSKTWFESKGYIINEYYGFLGHGYFSRYKFLFFFEKLWNKIITKINSPYLCSNAIVVLSKKRDS